MVSSETSSSLHDRRSEQAPIQRDASNRSGSIRDLDRHTRQLVENQREGKAKQEYHLKSGGAINEHSKAVEKTIKLTSEYGPEFQGLLAGTKEEGEHFREHYLNEQEKEKLKEYRNGLQNRSIDNNQLRYSNHEGHKYFVINAQITRRGLDSVLPCVERNFPEEKQRMAAYIQGQVDPNSQAETSSHADQPNFADLNREERIYMLADRIQERLGYKDNQRSKKFKDIRGFMLLDNENKMTDSELDYIFKPYVKNKELGSKIYSCIYDIGSRSYTQK